MRRRQARFDCTLSSEARLKVIAHDLQERWKSSQPWKVEDYLGRFPEYANDPNAIVALVKTEQKAQLVIDTTPERSEIVQRFPQLASHLLEQMHLIHSKSPGSSDPFRTVSRDPNSSNAEMLASRYRMSRLLGQGAFGRVYLAVDFELERQIAIKVPLPERFQGFGDADTFLAEARTVARLNHPHIVPVYDMGRTLEGAVFVLSRFIEGTTLEVPTGISVIAACANATSPSPCQVVCRWPSDTSRFQRTVYLA